MKNNDIENEKNFNNLVNSILINDKKQICKVIDDMQKVLSIELYECTLPTFNFINDCFE